MKRRILWVSFGVALLLACGEEPASPPEPAPPQPEAKAEAARARLEAAGEGGTLVLAAIEAHGGLEAWYGVPTAAFHWEYSNQRAQLRFKTYAVVESDSRRAYHEIQSIGTPDDPQPFEGRFAWDGREAWIWPPDAPKINPRFWALTGYYFQMIPFVLADPGLKYEKLPDAELDGTAYDMVKVTFDNGVGDAPGDAYTLYIGKRDRMVRAIRYTVTYYSRSGQAKKAKKAGGPAETLFYYDDYVEVGGLKTPTRFRGFNFVGGQAGEFKNEAWATSISFAEPFDESRLLMPDGARVQPLPGH